jgi:hypothetical protein
MRAFAIASGAFFILVAGAAFIIFAKPTHVVPPPFDPASLSWSEAATSSAWEARDSAAAFVFDDKMWIEGGLDGNGAPSGLHHEVEYGGALYFNDIWSSTDGARWKLEATSTGWKPRRSMSIVEFKGALWMFGGWSPEDGYQSDVWQSHDAVHWTRVTGNAAFVPREGQWVEVWNGKLWMTGGVNYEARKTFNDVWYSSDGITWIQAPDAPWPSRWDHATAVYDGKLWMTGGMDLGAHKDNAYNDEWYTEDGLRWIKVIDNVVWPARQGHQLIPYHGYLWILGRLNDDIDGGRNDVWYSKDGIAWTEAQSPGWSGREDHWTLVYDDKMWVFSGMDNLWHWTNDVWVSTLTPAAVVPTLKPRAELLSLTARSYFSEYVDSKGGTHALVSQNPDEALPLASVAKLMTALVASETYGLGAIQDQIRRLLIVSDNAMADALAAKTGTPMFVARMNQKSASLGLSSMHFVNPSGIDAEGDMDVASAHDVATFLKYLYTDRQALFSILGEKTYGTATSTDDLLFEPAPLAVLGGKTGETPRAKQNLAILSQSPTGTGYIVSVVLRSSDRFADMKKLLQYDKDFFTW